MCVIDRIIENLKTKGYTQVDLAERLKERGVTKQTIIDWKSGTSNSYYILIADIADFLNTTTDYLLTGKENNVDNIKKEEISVGELAR